MKINNTFIVEDPIWGFRRLDPIPSEAELNKFYQDQYYELILKGERGANICRLLIEGEDKERERQWLHATLYNDILTILERHINSIPKCLLDIGCGTGDFLSYMKQNHWEVTGLELSQEATSIAKSKNLEIYDTSLNNFIKDNEHFLSSVDVVSMLGFLEHTPNPAEDLNTVKKLLVDSGIVVITVPNDFNELQLNAHKHLMKDPWWIAIPDHINYFNFQSLPVFLERLGFEIIYSQADFPMEFFLLMGNDYIGNREVGNKCHWERVNFEMAIPGELRRRLYKAFAEVGIGRNCVIFARVKEKKSK